MNRIMKTIDVDYVIANDTDSGYLDFSKLTKLFDPDDKLSKLAIVNLLDKICNDKFQPLIDDSFEELADLLNAENFMSMKREAIVDKGIWLGKKRYVLNVWNSEGVAYKEPKVKNVGTEAVRSSTPQICRDAIKESYKIILNGSQIELIEYINKFRQKFFDSPFEAVAFPRGVSEVDQFVDKKSLYKKGTPQHVKAAIIYNDYIKRKGLDKEFEPIYDGTKIKFCYMKEPNPARSPIFAVPKFMPESFELSNFIDYDLQFEKSYLSVIRNIAEVIDWKIEDKATLADLF